MVMSRNIARIVGLCCTGIRFVGLFARTAIDPWRENPDPWIFLFTDDRTSTQTAPMTDPNTPIPQAADLDDDLGELDLTKACGLDNPDCESCQ